MTKKQQERADAVSQLREWIKPGDTVYTILDHVSASGMSRAIRVVLLECEDGRAIDLHPNYAVGQALDLRHWKRQGREQGALVMGGCGMDMGFALVYNLSHTLYGNGYACLGKGKCPSNYHTNHRDTIRCEGTRVYNPDGPDAGSFCWRPSGWNGEALPADWPRFSNKVQGMAIKGMPKTIVSHDGEPYQVCPTCKGVGSLPNPEGPERFDLTHTDGYALRHRWL